MGTKNPNAQVVALTKGGAKKWSYSSVAEIGTTPAIDSDGNIHICDDGGNYIILNADGTEKYKRQLGSKIWSSPVIADYGIVYVTYEDNGACKLIAIDCGIEGPANSPWAQRGQNAKRNALQK
ncbi:PQQ-binding-like beta-propeller repeat protein [Bacteroides ovatus]|nr:PQQ-binding-like beta-propeller repeat protein [Bacteroides ovatus]